MCFFYVLKNGSVFMKKEFNRIYYLLKDIVVHIRTGNYSEAASKLNHSFQLLQLLLISKIISPDLIKKLTYSLETILIMQEQKDWVAIADVIEYEFIALLENNL